MFLQQSRDCEGGTAFPVPGEDEFERHANEGKRAEIRKKHVGTMRHVHTRGKLGSLDEYDVLVGEYDFNRKGFPMTIGPDWDASAWPLGPAATPNISADSWTSTVTYDTIFGKVGYS